MSKNAKAKTKNARNTVVPANSATTTKNIIPKKLNKTGCRLLAIAVIKHAVFEALKTNNYYFFDTDIFHLWAGLAYGGKEDYRSSQDVINDILNGDLKSDMRCENGKRMSRVKC